MYPFSTPPPPPPPVPGPFELTFESQIITTCCLAYLLAIARYGRSSKPRYGLLAVPLVVLVANPSLPGMITRVVGLLRPGAAVPVALILVAAVCISFSFLFFLFRTPPGDGASLSGAIGQGAAPEEMALRGRVVAMSPDQIVGLLRENQRLRAEIAGLRAMSGVH